MMNTQNQYVAYKPRKFHNTRKHIVVGYSYEQNCRKAKRQRIIDKALWGIIIVMAFLLAVGLVNDFIVQPRLRDAEVQRDIHDRAMLDRLLTQYRDGMHHSDTYEGEMIPGVNDLMYYSLDEYNGNEYVVMATYSGWIYAGPVQEYSYNGIHLLDQHQFDDLLGKN